MELNSRRNIDRVAIVTGAGKRLGRQIAIQLGANGFIVIVNYFHSKSGAAKTCSLIRADGGIAYSIKADVSIRDQIVRMVKEVKSRFGKIDLLVNNAAIFQEGMLEAITEKTWDNIININLKSVFLCSQQVASIMLKQRRGRIINIASLGGIQTWKKHIPYSVSKAGVIMLTKCLAKALAPHITVNAIAPGTIIFPEEEDSNQHHISVDTIPLKRYGDSADITSLVVYLATTSSYITGQTISVDGGRSI
jgi:NAD(P)-dependent dehydrogenase (short-subunit alcohol dehydrogenase family)